MIARENYLLLKEFLQGYENATIGAKSLERYWAYLRHLLIWADDQLLSNAEYITPSWMEYIFREHGHSSEHKPFSYETRKKLVGLSRRFFEWAKLNYPVQFQNVSFNWIKRLAVERKGRDMTLRDYLTVDQIIKLATPPSDENDLIIRRSQAAAAMLFTSGMRIGAFMTLPVRTVRLKDMEIDQFPELGVQTKNNVKATTFLLQVPELLEVISKWDLFVRENFGPEGLWFPNIGRWGYVHDTSIKIGEHRRTNFNKRMKQLFNKVGLPYQSAHKFRHAHAVYGLQHARDMSDYKAVSLNLMHGDIKITDSTYAYLSSMDTKRRILGLSSNPVNCPDDELAGFLARLSNDDLERAIIIAVKMLRG